MCRANSHATTACPASLPMPLLTKLVSSKTRVGNQHGAPNGAAAPGRRPTPPLNAEKFHRALLHIVSKLVVAAVLNRIWQFLWPDRNCRWTPASQSSSITLE
jgi:hypothetical protein